jgi:DNA primase
LAHRAIRQETILEYRLGFAPPSWEALAMFFQNKGVSLKLAETLGLILPRKDRGRYYDRFRQRVMFPIQSEGGRVIGFGGRIVEDSSTDPQGVPAPKYMNSPESPIYSKGLTLYGIHLAKGSIREQGVALIVEGYMDLLSLVQEGIRPVVASLGTALTRAQVALLGRYAREAVLVFDADEGGKKATQRSLELFLQEGISARVASLPSGFDPDTFIRKEKRAGFENVLAHSLPVVDYLLEKALRSHPVETVEGKVRAVREVIPALASLRDPLTQNLYIERVASRVGLKESSIRDQLRTPPEPLEPSGAMPARKTSHGPMHERLLLQLMLTHPAVIPQVGKALGQEGFSDRRHQKLAQVLLQLWEADSALDLQKFFDQVAEEDLRAIASELLLAEASVMHPDRMLRDCLRELKLSRLRQEIQHVDDEIRQRSRLRKEDPWEAQGLKELLKRKQRLILEQKHWLDEAARGLRPA